jgi:predicted small integral membrane protein
MVGLERLCRLVSVAVIAAFFTLVSLGNVKDYGSNWAFVQHVLSMDTIFPDSTLKSRAITDPATQVLAYQAIIVTQIVTAVICWLGVLAMLLFIGASSRRFSGARTIAIVGLTIGFVLYGFGFLVVGGEYFAMWQSSVWNGQEAAARFITMILGVLIFVSLPERGAAYE